MVKSVKSLFFLDLLNQLNPHMSYLMRKIPAFWIQKARGDRIDCLRLSPLVRGVELLSCLQEKATEVLQVGHLATV